MGRRWNGWGSDAEGSPLSERARGFLAERAGVSVPAASARRETALQAVGASRLPAATAFQTDAAIRLDHAFGQAIELIAETLGVRPCVSNANPNATAHARAALPAH